MIMLRFGKHRLSIYEKALRIGLAGLVIDSAVLMLNPEPIGGNRALLDAKPIWTI